jgi:hypothetical protein
MYSIPRSFRDRLHALDPKLGAFFNQRVGNVIITYKRATGEPVPILRVMNDDESFRVPDQRVIDALHQSDGNNIGVKERMSKISKHMEDVRAARKREVHGEIAGRTRDDKYQLQRAFAQVYHGASGKVGRHVRRMINKPRGEVFK